MSRKRRARRRRRIVRFSALVILLILILALARRCGRKPDGQDDAKEAPAAMAEPPQNASVVFRKDGSVTVTSVEAFDKDYYSEEELTKTIKDSLASYNADGRKIRQDHFEIENGYAVLTLDYDSTEDYAAFNETPMYYGTVAGAQEKGYDLSYVLSSVNREDSTKILTSADFEEFSKNDIVIVTHSADITVPKRILYASKNLEVTDDQNATPAEAVSREEPAILILNK